MSTERLFGGGLLALGAGQLLLAAAAAAEPGGVESTTWLTAFTGASSLALGALVANGRLSHDASSRHRQFLVVIATASLVAGLGATAVGVALLVEHFLV